MEKKKLKFFNYKLNQFSPVQEETHRVVHHDEDGSEIITFEPYDLKKYQESLGSWNMWSLDSLLKAGINPNFSIHTGMPTRIEGAAIVEDFAAQAETILSEENKDNK